ncbi:MAG: hypothetical protein WCK54_09825 [Desulfuromonadales bacterium]
MNETTLLERLSRLGLPLMETSKDFDVNMTLAEVVKSKETRLWEGFPVLLVNSAKDYRFDYFHVMDNLTVTEEKENFKSLLLLSLALYEHYHVSYFWTKQLIDQFTDQEKSQFKKLKGFLAQNDHFDLYGTQFQAARLKGMFDLYFEKESGKSKQRNDKYAELSLEFALSQLFSPKQKELFKKKLDGQSLSKTEKEYYSRAVKKKVASLANPELHRLAQKLMQY